MCLGRHLYVYLEDGKAFLSNNNRTFWNIKPSKKMILDTMDGIQRKKISQNI